MSRASRLIPPIITALALVAGAITYWQLTSPPGAAARGESQLNVPAAGIARLQDTTLSDAGGQKVAFSSWRGKVLVVNFWATWCAPCIREMPELSQASRKFAGKGVQFVGIGIDSPSAIKEYVLRRPVSYPILIGGTEGLGLARALGNATGGLPFTVIIDATGKPVFARLGAVDAEQLNGILAPLVPD